MMAVSEAREHLYAHVVGGVTSKDELARCSGALEALDRVLDHGALQGKGSEADQSDGGMLRLTRYESSVRMIEPKSLNH
jgi:hypothetical protein